MGLFTDETTHGLNYTRMEYTQLGLHKDETTRLRLYMDWTTLGRDYAVETTYK